MPTTDSPGLCATPSPTGATAGGTCRRRSPSPHTSDDGGDGRAPSAQAMGAGGGGQGTVPRDAPPMKRLLQSTLSTGLGPRRPMVVVGVGDAAGSAAGTGRPKELADVGVPVATPPSRTGRCC